jgi:hypothetical protein
MPTFMPESPETPYQPAPVSMPPIVVVPSHHSTLPAQPARAVAPQHTAPAPDLAPVTPVPPMQIADAGLIRETFLRPRPRPGDGPAS